MTDKFKVVLEDNGYFTHRTVLDEALTAQEIAEKFPGTQCPDEKTGVMKVMVDVDEKTKDVMEFYMEEREKAKYLTQRPQAFDKKTFMPYSQIADLFFVIHHWGLVGKRTLVSPEELPKVEQFKQMRENLKQIEDPEKNLWYIWEHDMPCADNIADYDWNYAFDNPDFRPFLIPYMLEDQSQAVGNIIMISGGAQMWRSNTWEGYPAVERFKSLGYNCFLLQRRVAPFEAIDSSLDLQRSIRYIRHYAEKYHIEKTDRMAVCGYSGGGITISHMLANCYDKDSPEKIHPSYVPDEIDSKSAAVSCAMLIYGIADRHLPNLEEGIRNNPNLPAIFMVAGQDDFVSMDLGSCSFYKLVRDLAPAELHLFARTGHGFGVGGCVVEIDGEPTGARVLNTEIWPELADTFMKQRYGVMPQYEKIDW